MRNFYDLVVVLVYLLFLLLLTMLLEHTGSFDEYVDVIDGSLCRGELRAPVAFALGQPGDLVRTVSFFVCQDDHADCLLLVMPSLPSVSLEAPRETRRQAHAVVLVDHVPVEGKFPDRGLFEESFVDFAVPSVMDFFRGQKGSAAIR
jgi:hypothetical protein